MDKSVFISGTDTLGDAFLFAKTVTFLGSASNVFGFIFKVVFGA
jgi:hypothetical protein